MPTIPTDSSVTPLPAAAAATTTTAHTHSMAKLHHDWPALLMTSGPNVGFPEGNWLKQGDPPSNQNAERGPSQS